MKVKCDHRSKFSNLSNWIEEALKKIMFNSITISEKLGPSKNGRMELNFPFNPIFEILGQPREVHPKFQNEIPEKGLFHSLRQELPEYLVEWKASKILNFYSQVLLSALERLKQ